MVADDPPTARAPLRGSIKTSIVATVVAANLVAFGLFLVVLERALAKDGESLAREYTELLNDHLGDVVDFLGRIRARSLLDFRGWQWFDDVMVVQAPTRDATGRWRVEGVHLNPIGLSGRALDFDQQRALGRIAEAVETGRPVSDGGYLALPFGRRGGNGAPWGAALVRERPVMVGAPASRQLVPLFAVTLLGVSLVALTLLRRRVLEPVDRLASAARRLEAGDLSARVALADGSRDELGLLGARFNEMAAHLERYNAELEEAVAEATDRVRAAEAAAMTQRRLAATGELAAGIAHELNNPLGGLMNAVEALKRPDLAPARRREYLELVSGGLARMGETVGRLLRLSPREADLADVPLGRPLQDALGLVRHRAEGAGVELVLRRRGRALPAASPEGRGLLEGLAVARGSANELGQAFLNLLVNALDAIDEAREGRGPHGGAGRVAVDVDGALGGEGAGGEGTLRLVFEDDAGGVDAELLQRVADPFFTTKEQGKGTGLGLAIVHNVIAAHGGRVLLDGRPGRGLAVTIELPRAAGARPDAARGGPLP